MPNHLYEADVTMPDGKTHKLSVHQSGFPKDHKIVEAELRKLPAYRDAQSITIRDAQGEVDMSGHPLAGRLFNAAGQQVNPDHSLPKESPTLAQPNPPQPAPPQPPAAQRYGPAPTPPAQPPPK